MNELELLNQYINEAKHLVFFGGAGVSTASGLKDFRSEDGLYHEKFLYSPEEVLSHSFFMENTEYFYSFYEKNLNSLSASPNICHKYLSLLEQKGKLKAIITQNIDGLHQKAGSKNVIELHGTIMNNYCMNCNSKMEASEVFSTNGVPHCRCGGIIKPAVTLYEEALDEDVISRAIQEIDAADVLIIAGTSLVVYPASAFVRYFHGKHLIIINRDTTFMDSLSDLVIHDDITNVFQYLDKNRNTLD